MDKMLIIDNCGDCKSFYSGGDMEDEHCIPEERAFDNEPFTSIPDWCPLPDADPDPAVEDPE